MPESYCSLDKERQKFGLSNFFVTFVFCRILLTRSGNPHYHFSKKQQETLAGAGIGAEWTDSVEQALTLADSFSDPIVILGTTSVISEVEQIFQ